MWAVVAGSRGGGRPGHCGVRYRGTPGVQDGKTCRADPFHQVCITCTAGWRLTQRAAPPAAPSVHAGRRASLSLPAASRTPPALGLLPHALHPLAAEQAASPPLPNLPPPLLPRPALLYRLLLLLLLAHFAPPRSPRTAAAGSCMGGRPGHVARGKWDAGGLAPGERYWRRSPTAPQQRATCLRSLW